MSWADLFGRATAHDPSPEAVRDALADHRDGGRNGDDSDGSDGAPSTDVSDEERAARVVADADVLASDLLIGGPARDALDHVRAHSWVVLLASDVLLADAEAVITALSDEGLAADWRDRIDAKRTPVTNPAGDHPGLASAYRGEAGHLLTFEDDLRSVEANLSVQPYADLSVRSPDAFARLFDPGRMYPAVADGEYLGPDCDSRG
jgi:hypothetical protein